MAIVTELRDPRIENVTVTFVEVSGDLRAAKVHVSVMGDERQQELALHGLQNAAGFLQQRVGSRVDTRYTPRLRFELDQGVKHSIEVSRLLDELLPENESPPNPPVVSSSDADASSSDVAAPGKAPGKATDATTDKVPDKATDADDADDAAIDH